MGCLLLKKHFFAVVLIAIASTGALAQDNKPKQDVLDKKDTRVEPTSWGNVYGRVYDAQSGAPIGKANIAIEGDDGFEEKGRSVGTTDDLGGYRAQAILGRISHNLDVGRALLSSGIGLLFGSANNTTKRIDVAQLTIRVSAPGYKTFEGQVVARGQDAGKFRIDMEPILLVKEGEPGISVSATTWSAVRIESAAAQPNVARKGDLVKLTASVVAFGKDPEKTIQIVATSRLWKGEKTLKLKPDSTDSRTLTFQTDYKVSGREKLKVEPVYFWIKKSILDYDPDKSARWALVQIVSDTKDEDRANLRLDALNLRRTSKKSEALGAFKSICSDSPTEFDLQMLAYTAEDDSDWDSAANAWIQLTKFKVNDGDELAEYAHSLYLAKQFEPLIENVQPRLDNTKQKDWPKVIPASAVGYLGLAYVKAGKVEEASKLNEDLLKWPQSGLDTSVIEFRGALRLAEVEKANAASPDSPSALADYGRALLDLGRFEEAIGKLQASLEKDPNQQAVKRDLTWAALQVTDAKPESLDLQTAVDEARVGLNLDKGKQRSKDFFSWNQYAVLLYALSEKQHQGNEPNWIDTQAEAITALREALSLGRVGAKRSGGAYSYAYGYLSGSQVAISGFAYPQANASFILLDSLKRLRKDPNDQHALFNQSCALYDLGQGALAEQCLARLMSINPDDPESKFLLALINAKKGQIETSETLLQQVLEANPIHPRANLVLANLLAQDGDVAGAAEKLAAHAKFYGSPSESR